MTDDEIERARLRGAFLAILDDQPFLRIGPDTLDALVQAALAPTRSDAVVELVEALDIAAGRLAWIAENEPGSRPDIIWRWENEARAALAQTGVTRDV